jgi:hypothetical protein
MAEDPVSFGISDARRIDRAVGWYEHNVIDAREPRKQKQFPQGQTAAQGRLTSALTACDNALTGATKFTFAREVVDGDINPQTDPVTMTEEVSGDPLRRAHLGFGKGFSHNVGDRGVACQTDTRRPRSQEDSSRFALATSRTEVGRQRLSNVRKQRKPLQHSSLPADDDLPRPPADIS